MRNDAMTRGLYLVTPDEPDSARLQARVAPLLHELPRTNPPTTAFARSCCACPTIRLGSMDKNQVVVSWAFNRAT